MTIFVPFDADTMPLSVDSRDIECVTFNNVDHWLKRPPSDVKETLLVAWTPRENVRNFVETFRKRYDCRYVVHMEDNEPLITATNLGCSIDELGQLPLKLLNEKIPCYSKLSHPVYFKKFVADAYGATALIDSLFSITHCPSNRLVFWPGAAVPFFESGAIDYPYRRSLGLKDSELVLAYTGNLHMSNQLEVRSLYLATVILNRRGVKTKLLRTGDDYITVFPEPIEEVHQYIVNLGKLRSVEEVARVLSAADILVQPGRSDVFNDYRFPSKLPEFFATGRPVLLPNTNLGRFVKDDIDCVLLKRGDAVEIADKIVSLHRDPDTRLRLAVASRQFAVTHFSWPRISEKVLSFYTRILTTSNN